MGFPDCFYCDGGIKSISCFPVSRREIIGNLQIESRQEFFALDLKLTETNEISITHLQL